VVLKQNINIYTIGEILRRTIEIIRLQKTGVLSEDIGHFSKRVSFPFSTKMKLLINVKKISRLCVSM